METENNEKIIEKVLALESTGKSKSDILRLAPTDVEEVSEILDILTWIKEEKESIVAPRAGLTKALKDLSVLPDLRPVEDRSTYATAEASKEPVRIESLVSDMSVQSPFMDRISKKHRIWAGGALSLAVVVFIFVFTRSSTPVEVLQQSAKTAVVERTAPFENPSITSSDLTPLFSQIDSEPKSQSTALSTVDSGDKSQSDPAQVIDATSMYNPNEL